MDFFLLGVAMIIIGMLVAYKPYSKNENRPISAEKLW
jgi:hypothetical protein